MDPTVQVALVSVLATLITTSGVIVASILNGRKEQARLFKLVESGVMPGYDEASVEDTLQHLLDLLEENKKQDAQIKALRKENRKLRAQIVLMNKGVTNDRTQEGPYSQ